MQAIDQRIAELEALDADALDRQWGEGSRAPDQVELMWRLEEARALRSVAAEATAAEWARAVWLARDLARQGESAQAVLDALLNEQARIDGQV